MTIPNSYKNQPVAVAVRGFLAPVQRETDSPTVFDAAQTASFDQENPPTPWTPIGRVENFLRSEADDASSIQVGSENAVVAQFRKKMESHVAFDMRCWGKLQMALASGGTHWNVLEPRRNAIAGAAGGEALPAIAIQEGSTDTLLKISASDATRFSPGDMVAVDLDYMEQVGYVGLGASAAYIAPGADSRPTVDFVRRVTFNVARIASIEDGNVRLDNALLGGKPPSAAGMQKIVGFAAREGGPFRQQWSALFFEETVGGGHVVYYYPRVQSIPPGSERKNVILGDFQALLLQTRLLALPTTDPQDGVAALWYRIYVPPVCAS